MQTRFSNIRSVAVGLILLHNAGNCFVDTCYKYHKRAPVKSVCGRVSNALGEPPDGVTLTLLTASGSTLVSVKADKKGKSSSSIFRRAITLCAPLLRDIQQRSARFVSRATRKIVANILGSRCGLVSGHAMEVFT